MAEAAIVLTGLAADDPVPGVYVETNFAQGEAAGSGSPRAILVLANKLSTGLAVNDTTIYGPDTAVPITTEADMILLAGAGSEAHRLFRRLVAVNRDTAIYWCFVTESVGAKATGTIVLATTATGAGVLRVYVGDEFAEASITTGMIVDDLGPLIVAAINRRTHWPVTAAYNSGTDTVTLTAKQNGPRGNEIRFMSTITGGIGTTATSGTDGFLSGGATADSNATALGTINPKRFYYIVSAAGDATQFGALVSQVGTQALPTNGIRQRAFAGSTDTLANAITFATGINAARAEIIWQEKSPWTTGELAANHAALVALFETSPNPHTNFAGFGNDAITGPSWKVPRSRVDTAAPSRSSIKSALNSGLSPIAVNPSGTTYLVNRITSRSLAGAIPDYRIRAAHKVTICDFFADDLQAKMALQNAGKRIADDPPDGVRPPGAKVITPQIARGQVFRLLDDYYANDLLQNIDQIKEGTKCARQQNPSTRLGIRVPLQPIDNLEQTAIAVDQVA